MNENCERRFDWIQRSGRVIVAYWFHTRFGLELDALAVLSFGSQIMAALSMWAWR